MSALDDVAEQVRQKRSLWVELECPRLKPPGFSGCVSIDSQRHPYHCTVAYFGKSIDPDQLSELDALVHHWIPRILPCTAKVTGVARFRGGPEGDPLVWLLHASTIREMHRVLISNFSIPQDFDYTPHVTLGFVPTGHAVSFYDVVGDPIKFHSLAICSGKARVSYALGEP